MASGEIDRLYVKKYADHLELLSQQKVSRLRRAVSVGHHTGEGASPVDQIEEMGLMSPVVSRNAPKTFEEPLYETRWVFPTAFVKYTLVGKPDKVKLAVEVNSPILESQVASANRTQDDLIYSAMFGTAKTGKDGGTNTTFPAGNQVAVTVGGGGGNVGLNTDKIEAGMQLLMTNEVDLDDPNNKVYIAINGKLNTDLMNQLKLINKDYTQNGVTSYMIPSWRNVEFIHYEGLDTNGSGYLRCPMWSKSGMHLGVWQEIQGEIRQNYQFEFNPWEMGTTMIMGATRIDEQKVVELICTAS